LPSWRRASVESLRTFRRSDWVALQLVGAVVLFQIVDTPTLRHLPAMRWYGEFTLMHTLLERTAPPIVLVLGASSNASVDLQMETTWSVAPLAIISMLRAASAETAEAARQVGDMSMRSFGSQRWETTIQALMDLCPVVVLDGRATSDAVDRELEWMSSENHRHKLVVFGPRAELAGSTRRLIRERRDCVASIESADEFCWFLMTVTRCRSELPSHERPAAARLSALRLDRQLHVLRREGVPGIDRRGH
jgi:hypothetical protein